MQQGCSEVVTIRRAGVHDAEGIAHVHVQSWRTTYRGIVPDEFLAALNEAERVPQWQAWLRSNLCMFVAEAEQGIVGFAGGGSVREAFPPYDAELYTVYLLQPWQRRGLGKRLVHALVADLIGKGYSSMLVWVLEQNPAVHFYTDAGAQPVTRKQIQIGGAQLPELALGWPDLHQAHSATAPRS